MVSGLNTRVIGSKLLLDFAEHLTGLLGAFIQIAENDALRDEGKAFIRIFNDANKLATN